MNPVESNLRRMLEKCFKLLFLLVLLIMVDSNQAYADTFFVEIKQTDAHTDPVKVVCSYEKNCFLPVILEVEGKEIPTVAQINFFPGNVIFRFQAIDGYFYVSEGKRANDTIWNKVLTREGSAKAKVTLFSPIKPNELEYSIVQPLVFNVADKAVTSLTITIQKAEM